MRTLNVWVAAAGAASLMLSSSGAFAQAHGGWEPMSQGHRLGGEYDLWPTEDTTVMSWAFVGQIEVIEHLMIDFDLPWAYGTFSGGFFGRGSAFTLGNPTVGAHFSTKLTPNVALWAGGGLTIPTIFDPGVERFLVAIYASTERAFFDFDRFLPEYMTFRPRAGVEVRGVDILYYRGSLGFPVFIPVGDNTANNDAEFFIEQGNDFEVRAPIGVGGGVRLQLLFAATDTFGVVGNNRDRFQSAIEPYFVYEPPGRKGFFIRAGFLLALDTPAGFGFDRGKLATFNLAAGGKF